LFKFDATLYQKDETNQEKPIKLLLNSIDKKKKSTNIGVLKLDLAEFVNFK